MLVGLIPARLATSAMRTFQRPFQVAVIFPLAMDVNSHGDAISGPDLAPSS
jgi:hypothetical protein